MLLCTANVLTMCNMCPGLAAAPRVVNQSALADLGVDVSSSSSSAVVVSIANAEQIAHSTNDLIGYIFAISALCF